MYEITKVVFFSIAVACTRSQVIWKAPHELHPVRELYVKPSIDGTTGDLYVAATEENGLKSQWLTDEPVNFLPAATKLQPRSVPLSVTSSLTKTTSPQEDKVPTQKRAVITSPAIKYAYAIPIPGDEENTPYAVSTSAPAEGSKTRSPCSTDIPAQGYPFPYFYPQMMSAIASAMNSYKESEHNEENTPIAASSPYWPQAYGYPYQYVLIDPNMWTQTPTSASPIEASGSSSGEIA